MRLTYAQAQASLTPHAPADRLTERINRAHERLINSGKFTGTMKNVALVARYGVVTAPSRFSAILGVSVQGDTKPIANGWFSFLPDRENVEESFSDFLEDMGDGFATVVDAPTGGTLTASGADTGASLTVYGRAEAGAPLFSIDLLNGEATYNPFAFIERVTKETTENPVSLTHTSEEAVHTTLALMEAGETDTYYHRYFIASKRGVATANVRAKCKLRHVDLARENDLLSVTNLSALGLAMDSLQAEAELDLDRAAELFGRALKELDNETRETRAPGEVGTPRVQFVQGLRGHRVRNLM